uniref:Uncharacterized protein n=1 Tax=Rhizobium rhizogenes TaxID=359 RepID=A0A7S5DRZ8_RHIRH|nr:hypothetical protein pC6.5d_678 [Rhizobium rhizogenes]
MQYFFVAEYRAAAIDGNTLCLSQILPLCRPNAKSKRLFAQTPELIADT